MSTPFSFSIVIYLNVSFGILYEKTTDECFAKIFFAREEQ